MKTLKRKESAYGRYIIHALVACAMSFSWMTVSHANTYVHTQTKTSTSQTKSGKGSGSKISIRETQIDLDFIKKMEGSLLKGYVPLPKTTHSGVTIADGFDLGQLTRTEFEKLPITIALKNKLRPYVGLKKMTAYNFVKAHPLQINGDEQKQLNVVAANKILIPLAKKYEKSTGKSFSTLPANAQTALFSYAYQHGAGFMYTSSSHKSLWANFIKGNWSKVSQQLSSSHKYTSRRHAEASLLDKIV